MRATFSRMRKMIFGLILVPTLAFSQQVKKDTLQLSNGSFFVKGQMVKIGKGSRADGGYAFLQTKPVKVMWSVAPGMFLTSGWQGYQMKIVDFRQMGNETMGYKYYLVLSTGKKADYLCDAQLALENHEIE